jgi:hypothetical protein
VAIIVATLAALASSAGVQAQDKLKVAIGQINNWENQIPTLGMQAGIFQKHGLELETLGTQASGETLQPIISGNADVGIGVGTSGAMRVFVHGAPVRALAAGFTGTNDIFWYVRWDFADQGSDGPDREQHNRVLHQRFDLQRHRARLCQSAWRESEADRDWRPACGLSRYR